MPHNICRLVFIFLAIVVVITGGYHSILQSDVFLLEKVVVKGNNRISTEEIITASGLQIGIDKIYSLSYDEIEKNFLQKFIYIKHADIKREAPGTLIIEIVERKPVAIIPFHTANENVYGLIDIEGFILEVVDASETPADMIILTDVLKEGEEEDIFIKDQKSGDFCHDIPLLLDDSLSSHLSEKLESKAIQLATDTLRCILEEASPNWIVDCRLSIDDWKTSNKQQSTIINPLASLYSEILSINTKEANKITLKLKDDSVVWLSSDSLEAGFGNFKTVFLSKDKNKHYNYIDARFEGLVYCGEESK
ncbi:FtsQ-type POTRA domain-containing protein [Candidatus Poribacteria bacterium]|nr:FtsQ-type POTRA domain-containing protein [Candidatus Poribacteria bacterium]